jgi:chromosome partitioning protein
MVLKQALARGHYDYALLDLPPSLGLLSVNGLTAAGEVLIPARPEYLGLRALVLLVDTIRKVKAAYNPGLKILGILPTFYNPRSIHHGEVIQAWKDAGLPVLDIAIRQSVKVAEAPVAGQSIVDYEPSSQIADAYKQLSEVIDYAETR